MTKFFTVEQVIELHDAFLEDHGGLPGIRDRLAYFSCRNAESFNVW